MRKLKKALSLVLAIALVLGLCTIGAAAAFNAEIYNNSDEGISISLSRSYNATSGKTLTVTVIVDGETKVDAMEIEKAPIMNVDISIDADGYDVTYSGNNTTVAGSKLSQTNTTKDEYALTINLASSKTSDIVALGNFGNFRWAKSNAGNSAFQRTLSVYVNDEFKQDFSVNTPKNLSNAGATDQFWFEPNTAVYSSAYELDPYLTLNTATNKDLSIYLKTKCACGQTGCQCEGGCTCEEGCDCEYCQPVLGENQIDTGYGIIEYKQPTASGYNLTVKVYVNGQKKFTSDKLRVKSGENGCLDFTPANGYYYFATNGYDLSTKYAGSSWVQGTGYLSIIGALNDSRDYDNVLQIYIWTFQQSALLDVTRMPSVEEKVTGYTISYEAYDPKTAQNETFTYEATSFLNAQAQRIPKDTDVTLTAQCVDGFEVSEWLTHESAGNGVTLTGFDGEREWGAGSTLAYGNSATLNVDSSFSSNVQVFINGIKQSTSGPDDPEAVSYIVNYYYDGVLDTGKTVTGTGTVGEEITFVPNQSGTGYKLDYDNLPFVLKENSVDNVINVYYVKDESQTKELTYTVQYVDKDTNEILASENITVYIWVGDNTYTVTSLNAKTFEDYTFSGETEPPMNVTVHAGDIIKVFYIKDPEPREYAVNYHIVDANGNVMTDLDYTVYLTEDEFEGYRIWQPDGQAGCTFSGWFQKVSDLEANHAQVTELYTAKKWELYGRFTPNVPTDEWLQANVMIQVDCQTLPESVHKNMDTKLIADSYSSGILHANADGSWGYSFTVYVDSYLEKYNSTYGEHTANDLTKTVNLTFRNGEWQNSDAENNIYAVFDVECVVPTAPTAEQAAGFFKVKLDCLTSNNWGDYQHSSKQYDTTAESVTVGTVVYENGAWTCPVTIDSASYVAKYSEKFGEHTNSGSATQVKKLVYEGGSWKRVGDDVVAFDVKCAEPEIPTVDDIVDMFSGKGAVKVECITEGIEHNSKGYELVAEGLTIGNPEKRDNKLVLPITIKIDPYLKQYEDVYGDHTGEGTTKTTYKVFWDGTKWTFDKEKLPLVVFDVTCATPAAPNAPAEDELKALFDGKVFVDCVEKSWHPTYGYGLLTNGYTLTGPVKGADGEYTCTVTLLASAYLAEYNGDVAEKHALASYQGDEAVELKWTGSAWTVINGELPVTFDVVCDTWYPPIIPPVTPSEPDYTPNWLNTTDHVSYIIGYEDGTVKPNAGITRAEVATIFFRLLTDGARERFWSETNAYSDVAAGSWYNIAVSTLSNMGILGGYEDGTFRPNASITRAEFAKIAVSFFDWADVYAVNSFVDVRDSAWYANYVAVAAELGLIEGYGGNVFRPDATITRAEACTIINRTLGRAPDADHLLPVGRMNTWPDNSDTGVWYYAQIQEATNSHDYRWLGDIEQWTAKLADPDWDKLQY